MKTFAQQAAVTKMLTGIQGFDEISGGGLPRSRMRLVMSGPGCGKTVFAHAGSRDTHGCYAIRTMGQ